MNSSERFEIKARAFQIVTGMLAPGKDSPAVSGADDRGVRKALWSFWIKREETIIDAVLTAVEERQSDG